MQEETSLKFVRKASLAFVAATMVFAACAQENQTAQDTDVEWPVYNGNWGGTKYSPLDQINRDNVGELELLWRYRVDDAGEGRSTVLQTNPIVVDGVIYLASAAAKLIAIDLRTRETLWVHRPPDELTGSARVRGVTYWQDGDDRRIFYGSGVHLFAVNASNGQLVEAFGENGRIDLRKGLGADHDSRRVSVRAPGVIYKNIIVLGSSVGEGPHQAAPGHIRGYDVRSGEQRWIFHTVPHPGEFGYATWSPESYKTVGGANAWGGLTLDEKRGIVFAGTGSPTYDHWGGNRIGDNLFANSVLALNAETGERIWHYQTVHHDLWDYDLPTPPTLVSLYRGGELIDAVAQPTKMGHVFVLNRETGEPIFGVEERPVPPSAIPGETASPTQPFPILPPPLTKQSFTLSEVTDLSEEASSYVLEQLEDMLMGDIFDPPGFEKLVIMPQFNGGMEWPGAAYDPESRTLIVNTNNEAEWHSMEPAEDSKELTPHALGNKISRSVCARCHGISSEGIPGIENTPGMLGISDRLSKDEVRALLREGRGQMPAFAHFSEVETNAVLAYLFDEQGGEPISGDDAALQYAGGIPYLGTGHWDFRDNRGFPVNQRPWGLLNAVDLDTGAVKWQVPLGTYTELEAEGHPPTGTFNIGGPVVTAGGLVFIAGTLDERFRAFDKDTGEMLWEFQMDAAGYATPATFEVDGKQYVVMAGGGGGIPRTRSGDSYYFFGLPE
ncbi:MAG: PQQ-binding-like beta-propeller repeat protein [Gammaproteobacteria bacterium]|nr:PQQ-binding-like beta-propeller repeat protein [Gammaproteobacteria bacterium]